MIRLISREAPVVILTGARQVGKTTLLRSEAPFKDWPFHTLDDLAVQDLASKSPQTIWADDPTSVIDEVQRSPDILLAIKLAVDSSLEPQRFMLTGSANLLLMQNVSESLAGRVRYLQLNPMTLGEERSKPAPVFLDRLFAGETLRQKEVRSEDPLPLILRGFMPGLLKLTNQTAFTGFWESYATTYLERDLRQLSQVDSLPDFRRFMQALALRSGHLVNQTEIASDVGISQPTIHRYLNLLETSNLITRVQAYFSNKTSRLKKSPKAYWLDPGLASYLCGINDIDSLRGSREVGFLFETMLYMHLRVLASLTTPRIEIFGWRTTSGADVDFILETGRKAIGIEAKLTDNLGYNDTKGLRMLMEQDKRVILGLVAYTGSEVRRLADRIYALPWTCLTGIDDPF